MKLVLDRKLKRRNYNGYYTWIPKPDTPEPESVSSELLDHETP